MKASDQRLLDLVRQQRMELHEVGLITDREYADLASDSGAVARLETYDQMRAQITALRKRCEDLRLFIEEWMPLVESAMRQANRDGAEYDIQGELDEARKALRGGV